MTMRMLLGWVGVALARAASPTAWELNTFQDFAKARLENCSLTRDGRVTLAPRLDLLFSSEQTVAWSVAQAPNGDTYIGTGHKGRLYRVDRSGKGEMVWQSGEAEIFAVAVDSGGRVFAATSPNGRVYLIQGGRAQEYFNPGAKYIWSLVAARDGLFVGTGDEGKVFRVTAAGRGEVHYETGQTHVTSLALDPRGRLLAGTEPNGILYRVEAKDRAFVLHDANFTEIRAIAPAADGSVYVAAMGGAAAKQAAATTQPTQAAGTTPSVTTTITVTDADTAQVGADLKPKPAQPAQQPQQSATTATTTTVEYAGAERSAIFRIHPDNTVEQIWVSKEESAYDIAVVGAGLYIATDNQGRIYRLDADRPGSAAKATLVSETREAEVTRLLPQPGGILAATGELAKLFRLSDAAAPAGSVESPVHDATSVARWGKLSWRADACAGCSVALRTRSGNSARPDKTWSAWSAPATDAAGSVVESPNARYVQWRAELRGGASAGPVLDSVKLAYLPQNTPPVIKTVTVSAQVVAAPVAKAAAASATAAYSVTVTDTGDASATSSTGTLTQPITRASNEQIVVSWAAEDADGDKLIYSLHFRGEGESEWKPLRLNFPDAAHVIDAEALADGRYWFRVTASDRVVNPSAQSREVDLVSAPILVDRTPPVVALAAPTRVGAALEVRVQVSDSASIVRAAEYSLDAGPWTPLASEDGVADSMRETFVVRLDPVPAGTRLLVVRAYDSGNNAGVAKATLRP